MSNEIQPPKDKAERDARLDLVLRTIEENPQHWSQSMWHCGTSHCFAGFAQLLARGLSFTYSAEDGDGIEDDSGWFCWAWEDSDKWLGLCGVDTRLYAYYNTLDDLRRIVSEIKQTPYEGAQ